MFSYDLDAVNAGTADNGGFTLNSEWNQFFISNKTEFNLGDDTTVDNVAQRAYDYVSGLKDGKTQVVPFAKKASDWAKTQTGLTIKTESAAKIAVDGKYTATFTDLPTVPTSSARRPVPPIPVTSVAPMPSCSMC